MALWQCSHRTELLRTKMIECARDLHADPTPATSRVDDSTELATFFMLRKNAHFVSHGEGQVSTAAFTAWRLQACSFSISLYLVLAQILSLKICRSGGSSANIRAANAESRHRNQKAGALLQPRGYANRPQA
eukprot:scaffold25879_cov28-Tisochrysis_lutea.AAC.2